MAKNFKALNKLIQKCVKEATETPRNRRKISEGAAELIRKRTKLGFGVPRDGANKKRLKKLSPSYKAQRAGKLAFFTKGKGAGRIVVPFEPSRKPRLDSSTSPGKSNLTFSDQMLDSLKPKLKGKRNFEINVTGRRKDGLNNDEVAEFVSKERPFLHLSKNEIKQVADRIEDILDVCLRRVK